LHDRFTKRGNHKMSACRTSPRATALAESLQVRNRELEEQIAVLRDERARHRRSVSEAAQVQRKLSAPRQLRRNSFEVAGEVFAVEQVCGDFVTCFESGTTVTFAIGDILGKGFHAGMWFTHLVGLVRVFTASLREPSAAATAINSHLSGLQPEPPITTLLLGQLNAVTGELTYCNAGHPTPVLVRNDGGVELLASGGPLLGAVAGASYTSGTLRLKAGDTLVGYSDGLVECRNSHGNDFGLERLVTAVRGSAGGSANSILFSVLGAAQDFAASQPCADDLALLVVHRVHEHAS
jgi:serine phosphatase RsbU (regulator of sigma subunit)